MSLGVRPRFGTACVLAGGRGSRLEGMDKLHLEFGGVRLLGRIAEQLSSRFTDIVAVSQRSEALAGLGYTVVPDCFPGLGPLAGLHAALLAARSEWVYLVACDMPFFSAAWVDALEGAIVEACGDSSQPLAAQPVAATARSGRFLEPFHAFYHVSLVQGIEAVLSDNEGGTLKGNGLSIQSFIAAYPAIHLDNYRIRSGGLPLFFNINTREDIAAADTMKRS